MSLLSYNELCDLVDRGVIGPVEPDCINASSIDIHLGNTLIVERNCGEQFAVVDPFKRTNFPQDKVVISDGYHYDLAPGEFVLAHSVEVFNLPNNISAEFRLKSSGARSGLNNLFACHWSKTCDLARSGLILNISHNQVKLPGKCSSELNQTTAGSPAGRLAARAVQ